MTASKCATCGREHVQGVWWPRHPFKAETWSGTDQPASEPEEFHWRSTGSLADAIVRNNADTADLIAFVSMVANHPDVGDSLTAVEREKDFQRRAREVLAGQPAPASTGHTCAIPGDDADAIDNVAYDLRCAGCIELLIHTEGQHLPVKRLDRSTPASTGDDTMHPLALEVMRIVHAFSDQDRKDAVRKLARDIDAEIAMHQRAAVPQYTEEDIAQARGDGYADAVAKLREQAAEKTRDSWPEVRDLGRTLAAYADFLEAQVKEGR